MQVHHPGVHTLHTQSYMWPFAHTGHNPVTTVTQKTLYPQTHMDTGGTPEIHRLADKMSI